MLVRLKKRILGQTNIRGLHGLEDGPQFALAQPRRRAGEPLVAPVGSDGSIVDAPAAHVDNHDKAGARVGLEAVGGQAVVDGVQQAKVTRQAGPGGGVLARAQLEDVERAGENEGELQRGADGTEGVGRGVVGREDGRVEGVVLRERRQLEEARVE